LQTARTWELESDKPRHMSRASINDDAMTSQPLPGTFFETR
jgi:hypothetical protein